MRLLILLGSTASASLAGSASAGSSASARLTAQTVLAGSAMAESTASANLALSGSGALAYFERDLVAFLNTLGLPVYPARVPQRRNLPAITFFLVNGDSWSKLNGAAGAGYGRYQIGVSSTSYDDVGQISAQLEAALFQVCYQMGSTWVFSGILGNQITQYAAPASSNDKGVHTKINEFTFTYQKSIP